MRPDDRLSSLLGALVLVCVLATVPASFAQETEHPLLKGPELTLDGLVTIVERIDLFSELIVLRAIENRGLDFDSTQENLNRLSKAGASDQVLALVKTKAKPAPADKPPPAPTGTLVLTCAPAECTVSIDGKRKGVTKGGKLEIPGLATGKAVIDFGRPGYFVTQQEAIVEAEKKKEVKVDLRPTAATRAELGKKLLAGMLEELGAEKDLTAAGSVTLADEAGKSTEWNIDLITRADRPRKTRLAASGPAGTLEILCTGERCQQKGGGFLRGGNRLRGAQAQSVDRDLRSLRRYQLTNLIDEWAALSPFASTANPAGSGVQHLRLETTTADEWYDVTLGADLLPAEVMYGRKSGVPSALTVVYGGYDQVGKSRYPVRIGITVPDSKQAITVRFDRLDPKADIREKDFPK